MVGRFDWFGNCWSVRLVSLAWFRPAFDTSVVINTNEITDIVKCQVNAHIFVSRNNKCTTKRLVLLGYIPRLCMLPLVIWRRREYNTLADALAKRSMDTQSNLEFSCEDMGSFELVEGTVLQFHSDGGSRERTHAAAACTLTRLSGSSDGTTSRKLLTAHATYLGPDVDSVTAEVKALQLAFSCFSALCIKYNWNEQIKSKSILLSFLCY